MGAGPLALLYVMFYCVFVTFPCGVLGKVWCLIVLITDLCLLTLLQAKLVPVAEQADLKLFLLSP